MKLIAEYKNDPSCGILPEHYEFDVPDSCLEALEDEWPNCRSYIKQSFREFIESFKDEYPTRVYFMDEIQ